MTQQEDPPQPVDASPAPLEGLPKDALRRLAELQGKDALFTSDLSVNEFLLVKEAGFHPRGLVVGSSIYHIGFSSKGWSTSREVQTLTQAMYAARELAMSRMEEEAAVLGADGVVGVRLDVGFYEWGRGTAEFLALGTAVSAEDGGNWKTPAGKPFTSDLSGQDFWTLLQAGHAPLGLVMGTCVYHVAHQGMFQAMGNIGQNKEMPNFTQALYEARELAMERMQDEAKKVGAEGIVGVQIQEKSHVWGSHTIEFFSMGTAVRKLPGREITTPRMVLSLDR
ncbi:MAG: heavy metal-binding domain-containing protein [Candidatus Dormibacteria bacterium]